MATEIARRPFRVRDFCSSTEGGMKEREKEEEQLMVEGRARGGREEGREAPPLPPPPRSFICGGHKISRD